MDTIIDPEGNHQEEVFNTEKLILERDTPKVWNVWEPNNMEKTLEVDFAKFGVAITGQTGQKLSEITTFEFYASVEYLKEKHKPK